ncbi:hypothetical protein GQ44DRAFT_692826 [Phaeosphaeriaceae sp. PMI808]|nr:hypothetical protein GQ44DRAFT_692826 [Phaeosphaeriaceae sp. PMI808]
MFPSILISFITALSFFGKVNGQDNLGLQGGFTLIQGEKLRGSIVKASQTLASLNSSDNDFNFLPLDVLPRLAFNGAHHIGDITLRYRTSGSQSWKSIDSAASRNPISTLGALGPGVLAAANLASTLPNGLPLNISREWLQHEGDLAVRFNITNTASESVELGSLGLPININNIFTGRLAEETQQRCSLADPYIGLDAGYVRVTSLRGTGSALVITPLDKTAFEAWRFLEEPQGNFGYRSQTYEGNYEWQVHSLAYAQNEWNRASPWNLPTSKSLRSGETYSVGLRFSLAANLERIEETVVRTKTPLAVGIPGYVVPSDSSSRLYIQHSSAVANIDAAGAFTVTPPTTPGAAYKLTPTSSAWGRSRLTISYEDGKTQSVHYFITKAAPSTLADLGRFFTTSAHYTNTSDPFNRAPSILSYDREKNAMVEQDSRVWIAGLSDEGGTGAYLATAMKQFAQPVASEVKIIDDFVHDTIVGTLQRDGSFGIAASAFFYEPGAVNFRYNSAFQWGSWTSWNRQRAFTTRRAYNYVHPVATYWALYRIARDYPNQQLRADWSWYLGRAFNTTQYCLSNGSANCDYGLVGLMGEWVFGELLEDLKREGMTRQAEELEASMRYRAQRWETEAVPYGSEMAWDSTGQEGVYYWTKYFKLPNTPAKTINSILAYMPTVAHWGWNGNARRYWDFLYGAKIQQIERQIHHYGSGLNSLPILHSFEERPSDNLYALRVGFAGNTAPLTNIDQEGFASAAMHSFPDLLKWDPYSGDYGQGFLGLALGQGVYIVRDQQYGDLAFGGDIDGTASNAASIVVLPKDAVRRRAFSADLGLKIEISAGAIQKIVVNKGEQTMNLDISASISNRALKATSAIIWLKQPGSDGIGYTINGAQKQRGGWKIDFTSDVVKISIAKI